MAAKTDIHPSHRIPNSLLATAGLLDLSVDYVMDAVKTGSLPAYRHGRRVMILVDDARSWVRSLPSAARSA
jgi:hypothetical protein